MYIHVHVSNGIYMIYMYMCVVVRVMCVDLSLYVTI